jgi:hypothetical protein
MHDCPDQPSSFFPTSHLSPSTLKTPNEPVILSEHAQRASEGSPRLTPASLSKDLGAFRRTRSSRGARSEGKWISPLASEEILRLRFALAQDDMLALFL